MRRISLVSRDGFSRLEFSNSGSEVHEDSVRSGCLGFCEVESLTVRVSRNRHGFVVVVATHEAASAESLAEGEQRGPNAPAHAEHSERCEHREGTGFPE